MKNILDRIISDDLNLNELDLTKESINSKDLEEIENVSFLKYFISKNSFSEPKIPDTFKEIILNNILTKKSLIAISSAIFLIFFTAHSFFNNQDEFIINTTSYSTDINQSVTVNDFSNFIDLNPESIKAKSLFIEKTNQKSPIPLPQKKSSKANNSQNKIISKSEINLLPKLNILEKSILSNQSIVDGSKNSVNFKESNVSLSFLRNMSLSISQINPFSNPSTMNQIELQSFNNINISLRYQFDNFFIGVSMRRENFDLAYKIEDDFSRFDVTEFPNLTSGLVSFAYEFNTGANLTPFVNLEYGLNRRGHIFGASLGVSYSITEKLNFDLNLSNYSLSTFENIFANQFNLQYGISLKL